MHLPTTFTHLVVIAVTLGSGSACGEQSHAASERNVSERTPPIREPAVSESESNALPAGEVGTTERGRSRELGTRRSAVGEANPASPSPNTSVDSAEGPRVNIENGIGEPTPEDDQNSGFLAAALEAATARHPDSLARDDGYRCECEAMERLPATDISEGLDLAVVHCHAPAQEHQWYVAARVAEGAAEPPSMHLTAIAQEFGSDFVESSEVGLLALAPHIAGGFYIRHLRTVTTESIHMGEEIRLQHQEVIICALHEETLRCSAGLPERLRTRSSKFSTSDEAVDPEIRYQFASLRISAGPRGITIAPDQGQHSTDTQTLFGTWSLDELIALQAEIER